MRGLQHNVQLPRSSKRRPRPAWRKNHPQPTTFFMEHSINTIRKVPFRPNHLRRPSYPLQRIIPCCSRTKRTIGIAPQLSATRSPWWMHHSTHPSPTWIFRTPPTSPTMAYCNSRSITIYASPNSMTRFSPLGWIVCTRRPSCRPCPSPIVDA